VAFRDLEEAILTDLAAGEKQIIALGGGVILRAANRQIIANRGTSIWLRASAETLFQRISTDPTTTQRRPNLTASGGLAEIEELLALRTPLYEQCANFTVIVDDLAPDAIATKILHWLENETKSAV